MNILGKMKLKIIKQFKSSYRKNWTWGFTSEGKIVFIKYYEEYRKYGSWQFYDDNHTIVLSLNEIEELIKQFKHLQVFL
jgi:hypothetical protein